MANFKFLTVSKEKMPISFLLTWHIAREHYVTARVSLQQGMAHSGCLLAQQSVEMFIKAILHLGHKSKDIHYLPKLLERRKGEIPYFAKLLTDPKLSYFVENLSLVHAKMRFGEAGFTVEQQELTQVLDEVAFSLNKIYLNVIKSKDMHPFYVPDLLKESFLRNNKYFGENDISSNTIASIPLP